MAIDLTRQDREMLDGGRGEAMALAMRIVVDMADVWQADRRSRIVVRLKMEAHFKNLGTLLGTVRRL